MRYLLIVLSMLFFPLTSAYAEISVGISLPGISIGINMPMYPRLVRVPGYPVYYDPRVDSNYFFYDGLYWVFQGDDWYASSWYNGPWDRVDRYDVPLYVLRVPVRYYRQPPAYFRGWRADAPPRWGDHWGRDWEQRRSGWDQWNRRSAPPPAPLPTYQRNYSGDRYPRAVEQQHSIQSEKYRYQPREPVTQQYFQQRVQPAQQRQQEQQRQQDQMQQRQQDQQRQQQQMQRQDQQRQQDQMQQRQQGQQRQQQQPDQGQKNRAAPQDKGQKDKAAPKDQGREKRKDEERDQTRQ